MRDYGKVSPQFWIGKSGKAMRGNMEAQIVAMYLMTSPHAEMTGIYHCPILYIAHETGLSIEGATKGLQSLIEADFCTFEAETDTVFVHAMAKYQIGEDLKATDNRVIGVQKMYANMPESRIKTEFAKRYKDAFFLAQKVSPSKAPSKPETETETETETNKAAFAQFWAVYPKKAGKGDAEKAWKKIKPDADLQAKILKAVAAATRSPDWTKDGGQFIPHPATWLNGKRWEDALPQLAASGGTVDPRFKGAK